MIVRWLKRILLGVFLFALAVVASLSALVATEEGSHWLIGRVVAFLPEDSMRLELGDLNGNLLTGLDISFFRLQLLTDGETTQEYGAENISFRWQPLALFYSAVSVQSLHANDITVRLPVATQDNPQPMTQWPSFALPVGIELGDVELSNAQVYKGDKQLVALQHIRGSVSIGNFNLRMNDFSVLTEQYGVEVSGKIGVRYPYAADLSVVWHYQLPFDAAKQPDAQPIIFNGTGDFFGDLDNIEITHTLKTPFEITSEGSLSLHPTLDSGTPAIAPKAELTNVWQDQALLSQWFVPNKTAPVSSATLTVSGWYDNYRAQLNGEVRQPDVGHYNIDTDVTGTLKNLTIKSFTARQLSAEKNPALDERALVSVKGDVTWLPNITWNLRVHAEEFNPAHYVSDWPGNIHLDTVTEGAYTVTKNNSTTTSATGSEQNDRPKALVFSVDDLTLGGMVRGLNVSATGDFSYQQQSLHSDDLQISMGANQLHIAGDVAEELDLRWDLEAPLLNQIDPALTGSLSTQGLIKGRLSKPRMQLTATGKKLQWQSYALEELEVALQPTTNNQYSLALDAKRLSINESKIKRINVAGQGSLEQHQLQGQINSTTYGKVNFDVQSRYENAAWKGKFNTLRIKVKKVPRWWLTEGDWITVNTQQTHIGQQCFTTRIAGGKAAQVESDSAAEPAATAQTQDAPQLCVQGDWSNNDGLNLSASLQNGPLYQLRSWLKPDVTVEGVVDGKASFHMPPPGADPAQSALVNSKADAQLRTRGGKLRYQFTGEDPSVYEWQSAQLTANLKDGVVSAEVVNDWGKYGNVNGQVKIQLSEQTINGDVTADFKDLSPLEALLPAADDVQGRLSTKIHIQGPLTKPEVIGDVVLAGGSAKLPRIGLELQEIQGTLKSAAGGHMSLDSSLKSGDGTLSISGDLNNLGAQDWNLSGHMEGSDFRILQQPQLTANISPDITLEASNEAIRLNGSAKIPYARAHIKSLPSGATRVSKDVVVINGPPEQGSRLGGIPLFIDINLELGKDVHFSGFGLESDLVGKMHIVQSPPRAMLATGYVSVKNGTYKAYGQELKIERGRLLFQGPFDNPGLDIRAVRKTPQYEVGLEIGGTLQKPSSNVIPIDGLSVSESMAILLTGKPLSEAKPGDAYALLSAVSGLGMDSGPGIKDEITQKLHLDELDINTDNGFDQSSLWIGKYLNPRLFVRYVVGIFDETFSVGLTYQVTDRFQLEAESGKEQSIDIIYKIEK